MKMTTRQKILKAVYPVLTGAQRLLGGQVKIHYPDKTHAPITSLFDISFTLNDGSVKSLQDLRGKKILFVNTASDCGYTSQYESLQKLSEKFPEKLVVIGFPANDFKEQEKGDDATIASFCKINYGVSFPLAAKSSVVKGADQNPVFHWLSDARQNGWNNRAPVWNFSKFLVDEAGKLIGIFEPAVEPLSEEIISAIGQ